MMCVYDWLIDYLRSPVSTCEFEHMHESHGRNSQCPSPAKTPVWLKKDSGS